MKSLLTHAIEPPSIKMRVTKALRVFMVARLSGALLALPLVGFTPGLDHGFFSPLAWDTVADESEVSEAEAYVAELFDTKEILWFARAIHSESKFAEEQRYVAWVIRNRVESDWYPDSYQSVVLQPHQFSGLNEYDAWYDYNVSRTYDSTGTAWENAVQIAKEVYAADDAARLLEKNVLHFYSPIAVDAPEWAIGKTPVKTLGSHNGTHFAFFANIK